MKNRKNVARRRLARNGRRAARRSVAKYSSPEEVKMLEAHARFTAEYYKTGRIPSDEEMRAAGFITAEEYQYLNDPDRMYTHLRNRKDQKKFLVIGQAFPSPTKLDSDPMTACEVSFGDGDKPSIKRSALKRSEIEKTFPLSEWGPITSKEYSDNYTKLYSTKGAEVATTSTWPEEPASDGESTAKGSDGDNQ